MLHLQHLIQQHDLRKEMESVRNSSINIFHIDGILGQQDLKVKDTTKKSEFAKKYNTIFFVRIDRLFAVITIINRP